MKYPQPLDLKGTRAALDPGTLLLSYSVGEESTVLFSVSKEHGLEVLKHSRSAGSSYMLRYRISADRSGMHVFAVPSGCGCSRGQF